MRNFFFIFFCLLPNVSAAQTSNTFWQALYEEADLTNSLFFFTRNRDRYEGGSETFVSVRDNFDDDVIESGYKSDLDHTTVQFGLDYQSGRWLNYISYRLAGYGASDIEYDNDATRNIEHEFSFAGDRWGEENKDKADSDWAVTVNAVSLHLINDKLTATIGYSALHVPGIIGVNWSNHPGTYQGVQLKYETDNVTYYGAWADEYKAPWYRYTQKFYKVNSWEPLNSETEIDYIWGLGASYQRKPFTVEAGYGESQDYLKSYYLKFEKTLNIGDSASVSYSFYGSESLGDDEFELYQSLAWQQGVRYQATHDTIDWRAEAIYTRAQGFGNYIPRLTRGYANSQGASEFWWDARSDWNHDGEKAVFTGVWLNPVNIIGQQGWRIGASLVYGWGAIRWLNGEEDKRAPRGEEWAYNIDIGFTFQEGYFKGASINLHYTDYNNRQDELGSWYYPNMFTSERDVKLLINIPWQLF
ncbi:OprD family outer membrane porin [Thalassotalea euphylliae]|uniref:OprD family outer membrane porin n=1 Tax=Thalassotalea euphylliae TaxID=1655234 RepID=UPI00363A3D96